MWTPLWVPRSNCCLPNRVLTEIHLKINFSFDSFWCHKGLKNKGSETHSNLISARSRKARKRIATNNFPTWFMYAYKRSLLWKECVGVLGAIETTDEMSERFSLPFGICFVIPKWWLKRTLFVESRTARSGNTRALSPLWKKIAKKLTQSIARGL